MPETIAPAVFKQALIILGAAGVVIPMFHRLRISPVLGFILVGMAVGPFGLGGLSPRFPFLSFVTITDRESITSVAQLGVVLLLFMIGLELSFERLKLMRRLVFGLGLLQMALCAAALAGAATLLGQPAPRAVVIGLALAMSSTAVVMQVLAEEKKLTAPLGRVAIAVLLFQDLSVVPVMFAVGVLAPSAAAAGLGRFGLAIAQAALAVLAIIAAGRLALRPLLRMAARTRSPEMFMAACLLVVMATGLVTAASGLSMAMGALIAGLLLAETEYRRQVEVTLEPFKGLLVGVFLISVGMSLDLARIASQPVAIVGAGLALILLKLAIVAPLARVFGFAWPASVHTGLLLGPGGEFSLVLLGLSRSLGLLPHEVADFGLIVSALTMTTIPLLAKLGGDLGRRLTTSATGPAEIRLPPHGSDRVVVAGFGRVGQTVAAMLEVHRIPYIAVDRDPDRVGREYARGKPVYYGDITRVEWLRLLDLDTARALVVTLDERATIDEVVATARRERGDLLIVARARDAAHAAHLYDIGVSDAVPETIEASLQLSEAVLVDVGIPMGPVIASIHEKRAEIQAQIRAMAPEAEIRLLGRRRLRDALGVDADLRRSPKAGV